MTTMLQPFQQINAGDEFALAKKHYDANVIAAFARGSEFFTRTHHDSIAEGNSKQMDATWRATEGEHTEGDDLAGVNKPQSKARTITLEAKKRTSQTYLDEFKEIMIHNDKVAQLAVQHVESLLYKGDAWIAQCIALGARQAASGDFDAGNVVTVGAGGDITLHPSDASVITGTTIANAFPVSLKGSKTLQSALASLQQKLSEKFVPRKTRTLWVSPYLHRVLRQDDTLLSRDYSPGNSNDKLMAKLGLVEGFEVVETNNMPSTDLSADATVPAAYQGDFSKTVCLAVGDAKAVGTLLLGGGIRSLNALVPDKIAKLIGSAWWKGHNWLRPEGCCEIRITGT